jgi:predicted small lipoprotein YifL
VSVRSAAALLGVVAALAGCGLKGPLYLPEKSQEVVIRPAPGTAPEVPVEGATGPSTEPAPLPEAPPGAPPDAMTPPPVPDGSTARPPESGRG